ncbi:DHHC palmitoyltransferase-domain-containing protein [Aspergillus unguis]
MAKQQPDRRMNLIIARVIPVVLFGVIIYACYAVTKPLCIDYLIHPLPRYHRSSRVGAGAAIIAVFYILLLFVLVTYAQLLSKVVWNPDHLPKSQLAEKSLQSRHSQDPPRRKRRRHRKSQSDEKSDKPVDDVERALDYNGTAGPEPVMPTWDTAGLENFYRKDVFVCQPDGRPAYCSKCCHYKPDRTHHCREVDRCVRKMDHFCPWVGGVVSEESFKFFIQFVFYTAVFCIFIMVVCAIFTAELKRETNDVNPHWAIGIGLSGFFGLFTFGMTMSSLQLAAFNLTTIENLNRRSVVWTLAIRVPNHVLKRGSQWAPTFRTITYPLPPFPPYPPQAPQAPGPPEAQPTHLEARHDNQPAPPAPPALAPPPVLPPPTNPNSTTEQHVFAILQTSPGENPFALGSPLKNLQQVLGHSIADWLLPIKRSPCADHNSTESEFAMGPVVSRLRREAGLETDTTTTDNPNHTNHIATADSNGAPADAHSKRKRRRGKHHHHHHHHHHHDYPHERPA